MNQNEIVSIEYIDEHAHHSAKGAESARENEGKRKQPRRRQSPEAFCGSTVKKQHAYHEKKDERTGSSEQKRREINPFTQGKRGVRIEIRITILSHLVKNTRDFSITVGRKPRVEYIWRVDVSYWNYWCRRSESHRHGVEAPRDFETHNQRHVTQRNY